MRNLLWHRPESIGIATIFDGEKSQYNKLVPLFDYKSDKLKNVHRLDDMFANSSVLKQFALYDLWYVMQRNGVSDKILGPSYGKNVSPTTSIDFNKVSGVIHIRSQKTYSRRSESKQRTYPCQWIARRLAWFLGQSLYVESFKVKEQSDLFVTIDVKFKSCYSEDRQRMIHKRAILEERTRLNFLINKLEFAIENHDSIENLEKRLDATIKLRDNVERKFYAIKLK